MDPRPQRGGGGLRETVAHPNQLVRLAHSAIQSAILDRGAAVLVLPGDTDPDGLREALRAALAYPGPALVDVVTTPDALEVASHLTVAAAKGFGLGLGKVMMSGGVGEVANIARSNLCNIARP
ncbi:hypothetical protein [Nocardia sp. NBC_00416]|uniref:hypothetical protein n=1 Tax=Nocardia sp. NBC_00416 TaxID=2975991 RepID=UPI002E1E5903